MMKIDDKIILYLDNRLTQREKEEFEKQISNSPDIAQRVNRIKNKIESIRRSASPETDSSYFINMIPEFRKSVEVKQKNYKRKILYAAVPVLAAVILLIILNNTRTNTAEEFNFTAEDIEEISGYTFNDVYSLTGENIHELNQSIDSLFASNLMEDPNSFYLDNDDFASLLSSLSEEETEFIYNEIINKDLFNGEL
jgi:hypothetical protein